ncbi:MAG TPA: NAD(P)/FAD-dependent oxidoreductase [Verrucomicrobiae bacterium]|nr:NAD(P)/FAD-dependent oxidoreductase [Verrucomicrobiae bacterium]
MQQANPRIVVLGAGFGGLTFCQEFRHPNAQITLVDRQNHHLFQPLLYQVATAGLSAPDIAQPIRSILADQPNVTVLLEEVKDINLNARTVSLADKQLAYDYLVIALGGATTYFGHPEWEEFAPGLKSLDDALRIRREILLAFEKAETTEDPIERQRLMTIVVVGGGPTGVELAGAFAELARNVLHKEFRRIDPSKARVILIEGSNVILNHLPPELAASAQRQLESLGVEVRTSTRVTNMSKGRVETTGGVIDAGNIVWAAGVGANSLTKRLGVEIDRGGRIKVLPDLSLPGHPEAFAIGDIVSVMQKDGTPVPGVSPAAIQMAQHVAEIIRDDIESQMPIDRREAFEYWDKGTMATIGRSRAVAKIGHFEFSGYPAWLAWLFIHLIFLVGLRNKIAVLFNWGYSYFTYKRGSRLITGLPGNAK